MCYMFDCDIWNFYIVFSSSRICVSFHIFLCFVLFNNITMFVYAGTFSYETQTIPSAAFSFLGTADLKLLWMCHYVWFVCIHFDILDFDITFCVFPLFAVFCIDLYICLEIVSYDIVIMLVLCPLFWGKLDFKFVVHFTLLSKPLLWLYLFVLFVWPKT